MLNSLNSLISQGIEILKKSGIESPRLGAELLLSHVLGLNRYDLYIKNLDISFRDPRLRDEYFQLLKKRASRVPIAYLIGEKEFWSRPFKVGPGCLIPRPETELLIEVSLQFIEKRQDKAPAILDLGTGSGCIAITLFLELSGMGIEKAKIYASDISEEALKIAQINAKFHGAQKAIHLIRTNWLTAFKPRSFDLIVSNPPYISESDFKSLAKDVRDYEPQVALLGGHDGLYYIKKTLEEASLLLKDGGALIMEIGYDQHEEIIRWLESADHLFSNIEIRKDLSGIERVVFLNK